MLNHRITFEDKDIVLLTNSFPKGMKALREFMQDIFDKGTPEGEQPPQVDQHVVNSMLFFSPRVLYDFFDEKDININVSKFAIGKWYGTIYGVFPEGGVTVDPQFDTRQRAERHGYMEAFRILETRKEQ